VETLEDLAYVKSVVAESARPGGYAVLNADDPLVVRTADRLQAQVAYFSTSSDNAIVQAHTQQGGLAAVYENGYLSILQGNWILRIEQAANIPLTMEGRALFMIANALAASLAAFAQGISIEEIRTALSSFQASVSHTPGRMNLFDLGSFHALVDYAHNPAGYAALGSFVQTWPGERIGVIGGPGDRRDEDLQTLGELSAHIFSRVIVKEDDDPRDRDRGEAAAWIVEGLHKANPTCQYETILDEVGAIVAGLETATPGSLVVILPADVSRAIALIESHRAAIHSKLELALSSSNGHTPGVPQETPQEVAGYVESLRS